MKDEGPILVGDTSQVLGNLPQTSQIDLPGAKISGLDQMC